MNTSAIYTKPVGEQTILAAPMALPFVSSLSIVNASYGWHWHWYYIVYTLLAWEAVAVLWKFWWKAPTNVIIAAYPTPLGRLVTALCMTVNSETLLQKAYDSANGKPFAIPMMDRWIVFVTDRSQLKRLECEPESVLSSED